MTVEDKARHQRIIDTASKIVGTELTSVESLYQKRLLKRAESIVNDLHHPSSSHFELMKSGLRYRSIATRTNRFGNSFFPSAVRAMNGIFYLVSITRCIPCLFVCLCTSDELFMS